MRQVRGELVRAMKTVHRLTLLAALVLVALTTSPMAWADASEAPRCNALLEGIAPPSLAKLSILREDCEKATRPRKFSEDELRAGREMLPTIYRAFGVQPLDPASFQSKTGPIKPKSCSELIIAASKNEPITSAAVKACRPEFAPPKQKPADQEPTDQKPADQTPAEVLELDDDHYPVIVTAIDGVDAPIAVTSSGVEVRFVRWHEPTVEKWPDRLWIATSPRADSVTVFTRETANVLPYVSTVTAGDNFRQVPGIRYVAILIDLPPTVSGAPEVYLGQTPLASEASPQSSPTKTTWTFDVTVQSEVGPTGIDVFLVRPNDPPEVARAGVLTADYVDATKARRSLRLDLSESEKTAAMGVTIHGSCTDRGLSAELVGAQVTSFFERNDLELNDAFPHLSSLSGEVGRLESSLGDVAAGAFSQELKSAMSRLWSRGFKYALHVELTCGPGGYSIVMRRINVAGAATLSLGGASRSRLLDVGTLSVTQRSELRFLIDGPLSDLYGVPLARFVGPTHAPFASDPRFEIEVREPRAPDPPPPTTIQFPIVVADLVRGLAGPEPTAPCGNEPGSNHDNMCMLHYMKRVDLLRGSACDAVAAFNELRSDKSLESLIPERDDDPDYSTFEMHSTAARVAPDWPWPRPGRYLVAVKAYERARPGARERAHWAFACVDLEEEDWRLAFVGEMSFRVERQNGVDGSRPEFTIGAQLLPQRPGWTYGAGVAVFYSFTPYRLDELPSWDAARLPSLPAAPSDVAWVRHGLGVMGVAHFEWSPWRFAEGNDEYAGRANLFSQVMGGLDVGFYDMRNIPVEWTQFRESATNLKAEVDVDVMTTTGVRMRVGNRGDVIGGVHFGYKAIDDAVLYGNRALAKSDPRIVLGLTVGGGFGL